MASFQADHDAAAFTSLLTERELSQCINRPIRTLQADRLRGGGFPTLRSVIASGTIGTRSFVDPWEQMLLSYTLQHFVELCIIYHRDDPQLHQIAPHEREFCQGFGVVAFQ
jgi:hypothetical protein